MGISLVLLSLIFSGTYATGKTDSPPVIVLPADLDDPKSLTIIGNSSQLSNRLICGAKNADYVEWKYKVSINSQFSALPIAFTQTSPSERSDGVLYRELNDDAGNRQSRDHLNGYYQCFAKNNYGYMSLTPPIRLILPTITPDAATYSPKSMSGNLYAPLRLKCIDNRLVVRPQDMRNWNIARYSWHIWKKDETPLPIKENERIRIDMATGDLYFAFLEHGDSYGADELSPEYQCLVSLADSPRQILASRTHLTVMSVEEDSDYRLQNPITSDETSVTCIERAKCTLSCAYGGRRNGKPPSRPVWTPPPTSSAILQFPAGSSMSVMFDAVVDDGGKWKCHLDPPVHSPGEINLVVKSYPSMNTDDMKSQFIEEGTDVIFYCNPQHSTPVEFFFNGNLMKRDWPTFTQYVPGSAMFAIENAQREFSGSVACMASNDIGTKFRVAELNVYRKPNITILPEGGYTLDWNDTVHQREFDFHCTIVLDPKVSRATLHWRSTHSSLLEKKITQSHVIGISSVKSTALIDGAISSTLRLKVDSETQKTVAGFSWWCVVEFGFPSMDPLQYISINSEHLPFQFVRPAPVSPTVAKFDAWWVIGLAVAVFFFIILVILIVCCLRQNKGEQYCVDEKERKAGHDPKQELERFQDYKRPDQNPIKGSRLSMDLSEKHLDSDTGSMDEYGDIDPSRFNEDGSFLGLYGKTNSHEDV